MRVAVAAATPGHSVIWILGGDGRLSAYDGRDFHFLTTNFSPLPPDARQHPESISISRDGIVLYAILDPNSGRPLPWNLWENGRTRDLIGTPRDERPAGENGTRVSRVTLVARFGADGRHLFWFENKLSVVQRENEGDVSETGEFLSWTTDLSGRDEKPLVSTVLPPCKCETGACEETCPIIDAWASDHGVSDFFFLTRWIPGQTSPDFLETILYRAGNGGWQAHKLDAPVWEFLDAADSGNAYIAAVPDAGCCGWENESDNLTYLVRDGKRSTFFDEFARFHNKDYDVSFFTSKALLSPDASRIAYTIAATSRPGREIRLADQGKENAEELKKIRDALVDLPLLEVVRVSDLSHPFISMPNEELIGWLDSQRLLAWQHGQLSVINAKTGRSEPTGLKAESTGRVFIR